MGLSACLLYVLVGGGGVVAATVGLLERAGDVAAGDFRLGIATLAPALGDVVRQAVLPALLLAPGLAAAAAVASLQGIPFAIDPIVPKMERINPAKGFERMVEIRSLIELVKTLLKAVVIIAAFTIVLVSALNGLVLLPACGIGCVGDTLGALARPLLAMAAGLFLVAGLADLGLQRWLFTRDQRMSVSELKRERKDMDGDPHLRQERRRLLRETLRLSAGLGLKRATIVIHDGGRLCIGLRYKASEMSAPAVVCRARDERSLAMVAQTRLLGLPLVEDRDLAEGLASIPLAHGIPDRLFRPMALAMGRAGVVPR